MTELLTWRTEPPDQAGWWLWFTNDPEADCQYAYEYWTAADLSDQDDLLPAYYYGPIPTPPGTVDPTHNEA